MGEGGFVWSGDDSDPPEDGSSAEDASGSGRASDGPATPFEDLLDGVEEAPDQPADLDEFVDALSSVDGDDDPTDIDRLLERIGRERERSPATDASADDGEESLGADHRAGSALDGSGTDRPGLDPDEGSTGDRQGKPTVVADESPDLRGDDPGGDPTTGDGRDEDGSPARGPTGPFEDLRDRVDRAVGRRGGRDQPDVADPTDPRMAPSDAGALPADATGVLLLGSADDADDFDACLSLVGETTDPKRTNLLLVWLSRDVTGRLERLYDRYADRSTDVTVVCRSKVERSLRADSAIPADGLEGNLSIERISDPRDLPKLGIAISQAIGASAGGSKRTAMCFHSITDLLQSASQERVFRFLHVLQGRIDSTDATAYYHIDRDAHEQRTVATFWNLFDATVDLADGPEA